MTVKAWEKIQVHFFPLITGVNFQSQLRQWGTKIAVRLKTNWILTGIIRSLWKALLADECVSCASFWENDELFPAAGHGRPQVLCKSFSDHCSLVMPLLFKSLLHSRGWKYLWGKDMPWILFSEPTSLGEAFLHFETRKVPNRNVQLTVKHSHQFRDHFQIWWMSSKSPIHSNHQAEKQLNSWGEKSR